MPCPPTPANNAEAIDTIAVRRLPRLSLNFNLTVLH
jgi:hypothetical protein